MMPLPVLIVAAARARCASHNHIQASNEHNNTTLHIATVRAARLVAVVHEDVLALHVGGGDEQHEEEQRRGHVPEVVLQAER